MAYKPRQLITSIPSAVTTPTISSGYQTRKLVTSQPSSPLAAPKGVDQDLYNQLVKRGVTQSDINNLLPEKVSPLAGLKDIFSSTIGQAKEVIKTIPSAIKNTVSTSPFLRIGVNDYTGIKNKEDFIKSTVDIIKQNIKSDLENVKTIFKDYEYNPVGINNVSGIPSKGTNAERVNVGLQKVLATANIAFSPVTTFFQIVDTVPSLAPVSKAVTLPFAVGSDVGKTVFSKGLDVLPISNEAKEKLKSSVEEIGSLVGMLVVGGKLFEGGKELLTKKKPELIKKYGETDANTIMNKVKEKVQNTLDLTKETNYQPRELITKPIERIEAITQKEISELPKLDQADYVQYLKSKIENLSVPKENEVMVMFGGDGKKGQYVDTYIKDALNRGTNKNTNVAIIDKSFLNKTGDINRDLKGERKLNADFTDILNKTVELKLPTVQPSTKVNSKVSGVSENIQTKAIEQGMIEKGFGELSEYDSSTIKKQAAEGSKYSIEQLKEMADTGKLPEGLKPATPLSILEDYASKTKDIELMRDLAKSPLTKRISESASDVSLARMREKGSTSEIIRQIQEIRETQLKEPLRKTKSELDEVVKKSSPTKDAWVEFIDSLKC